MPSPGGQVSETDRSSLGLRSWSLGRHLDGLDGAITPYRLTTASGR
jgi:hypothetical protein